MAYHGATNAFALLRLLPMSSQEKDAEILALRHQVLVLQRQLGPGRVRFPPADRALLAASHARSGFRHPPDHSTCTAQGALAGGVPFSADPGAGG
jgi:hypothetical protein